MLTRTRAWHTVGGWVEKWGAGSIVRATVGLADSAHPTGLGPPYGTRPTHPFQGVLRVSPIDIHALY
jgi:hypothetical protein